MIRRFSIFIFFLFSISSSVLMAQDALTVLEQGKDLNVLYRNEMNVGVLAHSDGFGLTYRRCKHLTATRKGILEIEFVNMRHPKEVKVSNPVANNSRGYFYGKLNSFQILRPGIGFQKILYGKAERKSVEIRLGTYLGPSLGFVKPVYLEILQKTNTNDLYNVKQERYDPENPTHEINNIYGRAPYFRGFSETKIYPGGYFKLALSFEYADYHDDVKAIETGLTVDAFPKVIPILAHAKNNQLFLSFYISLVYGKKWF